ncbi:MAG: hypothetical protein ACLQGP_16105 [Isosphaeraceae bacterium]
MIELDYWDERRGKTIARVSVRDPATIPVAADTVYIPDAEQAGIYLHLKVTSRHFYYSQEGTVVTIRLQCEVLQ